MTDLHRLTIHDLSCDFRDVTTLLFRTRDGALGYAARRGNKCGYVQFALDGKQVGIDCALIPLAEEPAGYELGGRQYLYVAEAA